MRAFTRTTNTTKILVGEYADGEVIEVNPVYVPGEVTDPFRQRKAVVKEYGKAANVVVLGHEIIAEKRSISYDDFMKYAKVVTKEEEEAPNSDPDWESQDF